MSDINMDYPMKGELEEFVKRAKAKTFCLDFDEQLNIAEQFYGTQLRFSFDKKDVIQMIEQEPYYPEEIKERVLEIIRSQMRKYEYLFS